MTDVQVLPFRDYHPLIRGKLSELADVFPPQTVADAAQALADQMHEHAPSEATS